MGVLDREYDSLVEIWFHNLSEKLVNAFSKLKWALTDREGLASFVHRFRSLVGASLVH